MSSERAHTQTHPLTGIHPGLWWRDGDLGGIRDIQGKTELCNYRARARGTAAIIPVSSPPPMYPTGGFYLSCVEPFLTQPNVNLHWPGKLQALYLANCLGLHPIEPMHHVRHVQQSGNWSCPMHHRRQRAGVGLYTTKGTFNCGQPTPIHTAVFCEQIYLWWQLASLFFEILGRNPRLSTDTKSTHMEARFRPQ